MKVPGRNKWPLVPGTIGCWLAPKSKGWVIYGI